MDVCRALNRKRPKAYNSRIYGSVWNKSVTLKPNKDYVRDDFELTILLYGVVNTVI